MSTDNQKSQFLQSIRDMMGELGRTRDKANTIFTAYVERGYDAAASDPITQAQLDPYGVTVYDLGAACNLCQSIETLLNEPTPKATISKWRQV